MSTYKTDQRRLTHAGHEFHFVSYEGQLANVARGQCATPPTWYLMAAGKRWEVMGQQPEHSPDEVDACLHAWLDEHMPEVARRQRVKVS
jgi:hypothetical protein